MAPGFLFAFIPSKIETHATSTSTWNLEVGSR